jgi:hypothetical protein
VQAGLALYRVQGLRYLRLFMNVTPTAEDRRLASITKGMARPPALQHNAVLGIQIMHCSVLKCASIAVVPAGLQCLVHLERLSLEMPTSMRSAPLHSMLEVRAGVQMHRVKWLVVSCSCNTSQMSSRVVCCRRWLLAAG